ncbi:MAG TPA: DNA-directed RNA polymerase subunit alpha [archaeon]|nr:DNA-directed RNA polymerase subunit alpha [archaeon]
MNLKNLVLPSRIEKNTKSYTDLYGEFVVYPLERGFGLTLGNSLRRVLLSSLEGVAIWAVRIEGVLHELSTIPGVLEDMPEIILNLKKIVFKAKGEIENATCKLELSKKGEVTADQIQTPPSLNVVNKNLYLLSMKEDKDLRMELLVKTGRGYCPSNQHETPGDDPQLIPIDSLFCPVVKVSFDVEDQRVGQRTDYDKLTMRVHTNGSMTPEIAMIKSAELLVEHLEFLKTFSEPQEEKPTASDLRKNRLKELFNRSVEELELSVRSSNCLKASNIRTLGELVQKTEGEMIKFRNFGRKSLNEISEILDRHGMRFGMKLTKNEKSEWELDEEVEENGDKES